MTADSTGARRFRREAVVTFSAAKAAAVAVWLIPASIHIVKWPSTGPVRLALLAPTWHLAALLAGAIAVAVVALAMSRGDASGRLSRTLAPFSLLWLWVVPFLPWLPDRLPLLLVLAGPLRWAIAIAALVMALGASAGAATIAAAGLGISRRTVFIVSLVAYLALGIHSARSVGVGGDEPHYLIITESLLRDGDLQIDNNHEHRDYLSFYPGELRPDFFERGANGHIYSIHAPGLPALILPAYALGGRLGVVVFLAFLAAFTALAVFDLAAAVAGRSAAVITWVAVCFTVPFVPHAWLIFPELPGALVVAWAALWLWESEDRSASIWALRGAVLGALPWLHTKFVVFLAIFSAGLALRLWRRPRALAALAIPVAASSALWLYSFYVIYGQFDPEAPYGAYTSIYVLTENIPHGFIGIFFDQKFGLLFYSPIYLVAIAGAWIVMRRAETRLFGAVLLLAVAAFVGSTARLYMFWGGNSAPARFLVPLLPCLAPLMALAIAQARTATSRALIGVWLTISLVVAVAGVGWPERLMLFSDPHGRARVLEWLQAGSPLALVVPTFTDPDWASQIGQFIRWLGAGAFSLGVLLIVSRKGRGGACRLAGIACLSFLLAGAVLTAAPAAAVRDATALRGDLDVLWRFDGNRFRTLDYQTLARTTPEQLRELTTAVIEPQAAQLTDAGFNAGPFSFPPGAFQSRVWFAGPAAREGEVVISMPPQLTLARIAGPLPNPTRLDFDITAAIRRLMVRVSDRQVASAISRIEIEPVAVVPAGEREDMPVRTVEVLPGREGAYLVYTDANAYPERGVFWSRGTAQTRVFVAPAGASRMTLTLSTGPMSGSVALSVNGHASTVSMVAREVRVVSFDVPPSRLLVPVTIGSDVMFRPSEVDRTSTDARGLGCQVRITLE